MSEGEMMVKSDNWAPHIRALIYPVQFETDPLQGLDRVIDLVVKKRALGASPDRYLASVRMALASSTHLSDLIPQDHSEEAIRRFLSEVKRRLAAMVEGSERSRRRLK